MKNIIRRKSKEGLWTTIALKMCEKWKEEKEELKNIIERQNMTIKMFMK